MKEKITKAEFINTWASEWDEITGWKVSEKYHKQLSEQLEPLINQEVEKRIAEKMPSKAEKEAAEIMQHLKAYGMIHTVTAVKYPEGTHEDFIKRADEWIWRFRSRLTCSEKQNNSQKTEGGQI